MLANNERAAWRLKLAPKETFVVVRSIYRCSIFFALEEFLHFFDVALRVILVKQRVKAKSKAEK